MASNKKPLTLCDICVRQISGDAENVTKCTEPYECQLCFGIMDQSMIDEVGEQVQAELERLPYDSHSFILALSLPVGQTLREILVSRLRPDFNGTLVDVPYKIRNIDGYLKKLSSYSGKRPTLSSDLQLMITFEQEESDLADLEFLQKEFPNDFRVGKRNRNHNQVVPTSVTKQQLQQVTGRITEQIADKFIFKSPTRKCTFRLNFERDPVYIAGRYCKYSRCLPQSPWSEEKDEPREPGNSVSEKVCDILKKNFGASDSRFVTSGREDIDVRMLGTGRPFVVELRNCRTTASVRGLKYQETLKSLEDTINRQKDIKVNFLTRVSRDVAEKLSVGQEDKRKQYCAYCYSILPISEEQFAAARSKIPLKIVQKTPVRVLKRRSLLDRERTIYTLDFLKLDDHHFEVRLETQAGTYIKEFVHGDFGRTRPSLAELLGVEHGEVDILELDVEQVDLEWPPALKEGQQPVKFS
ncbi:hypothetical protein CAEBREN_25939 [Caenorhabditis brenneri]|uniref:tRNA pseudouridine(55) synthase n=1 Tax=Caenorhabditis brenneri TaxID=135651 RepID=G0MZ89_CAEBE|nr:hypothetical protein CAEBREN_25939 [Caenorhabditis brenneri]